MTITKETLQADRENARDQIAFQTGRLKQIDALLEYLAAPEPTATPATPPTDASP